MLTYSKVSFFHVCPLFYSNTLQISKCFHVCYHTESSQDVTLTTFQQRKISEVKWPYGHSARGQLEHI